MAILTVNWASSYYTTGMQNTFKKLPSKTCILLIQ